jgi:hypothetical protein
MPVHLLQPHTSPNAVYAKMFHVARFAFFSVHHIRILIIVPINTAPGILILRAIDPG